MNVELEDHSCSKICWICVAMTNGFIAVRTGALNKARILEVA
jgi:hypothetical protein